MGKPRSSARSRTIYLNFAFIVALRDYLYHTTLVLFLGHSLSLSLEFRPLCVLAWNCKRNDDLRSADRDATRKRENKRNIVSDKKEIRKEILIERVIIIFASLQWGTVLEIER